LYLTPKSGSFVGILERSLVVEITRKVDPTLPDGSKIFDDLFDTMLECDEQKNGQTDIF